MLPYGMKMQVLYMSYGVAMKQISILFIYSFFLLAVLCPQQQDEIEIPTDPPQELKGAEPVSHISSFAKKEFEGQFGLAYESILLDSFDEKNYHFSGVAVNVSLYHWYGIIGPFIALNGGYLLRATKNNVEYRAFQIYDYPFTYDVLLGFSSRMLLGFTKATVLQVDTGLHLNGIYLSNPNYRNTAFQSLSLGYGLNFKLINQNNHYGIYVNPNFDYLDLSDNQRMMRYVFSVNVGLVLTL